MRVGPRWKGITPAMQGASKRAVQQVERNKGEGIVAVKVFVVQIVVGCVVEPPHAHLHQNACRIRLSLRCWHVAWLIESYLACQGAVSIHGLVGIWILQLRTRVRVQGQSV